MRRANLSKHLHGLFVFACVICLFAVFPLLTNGAAASVGVWTATGSLNVARSYHTATLLNSDEVLVVGGDFFGALAHLVPARYPQDRNARPGDPQPAATDARSLRDQASDVGYCGHGGVFSGSVFSRLQC